MASTLTAGELAALESIWPGGVHHPGSAADVFAATGPGGWLLIVKRAEDDYLLIDEAGTRSRSAKSLASLGLLDRPLAVGTRPRGRSALVKPASSGDA